MAKAKKLPSGAWRTRVYSHTEIVNGKEIKKYESFTADTKKESEYLAAEYALNKNERKKPLDISLHQAISQYISSRQNILSTTTIRGYNTLLNNSYSDISQRKLCALTEELIQNWANSLSINHSPKTVRNAHGLLSATLAIYLPDFKFHTALPMRVKPDLYVPSDNDIQRLLEHVSGTDLEIAILLGAFGAMRRGEICALTSDDIRGNTIVINKSVVRSADGGMITKSPKTTSSFRFVPMPQFVIDKLSGIDGKLVKQHPEDITKQFGKIIKELNLPHFRFHDLRHYSASIMHAIGIPDQYIMQRGGWQTDVVLKSVYRNVIENENDKFNNKINEHFECMTRNMTRSKKSAE